MAGKGSPWKHCSAVVCHLDAFPHRDHFPNRFLHHRPVWPTFNVVNRDQNWSGNFPCHMRLRAPLSFVCTFIFGQLFDRKRRFEDSFVLFGENGEDASGNVMQQPFDTPRCPPSRQGLLEGTGAAGSVLWSQGMGSVLGVRLGVARPGPPPSNGPSPAVALSVGLNNPGAALLRVGGWSKTQPLPLAAPASLRWETDSTGLAPGKQMQLSVLLDETWCMAERKRHSFPCGGLGTGVDINLVINWGSTRTDGSKD